MDYRLVPTGLSTNRRPQILQVYASRLCFYCDSQSDPSMQDQVAEVRQ